MVIQCQWSLTVDRSLQVQRVQNEMPNHRCTRPALDNSHEGAAVRHLRRPAQVPGRDTEAREQGAHGRVYVQGVRGPQQVGCEATPDPSGGLSLPELLREIR